MLHPLKTPLPPGHCPEAGSWPRTAQRALSGVVLPSEAKGAAEMCFCCSGSYSPRGQGPPWCSAQHPARHVGIAGHSRCPGPNQQELHTSSTPSPACPSPRFPTCGTRPAPLGSPPRPLQDCGGMVGGWGDAGLADAPVAERDAEEMKCRGAISVAPCNFPAYFRCVYAGGWRYCCRDIFNIHRNSLQKA